MGKERPTLRTVGKYALCQLPGVLLAGGALFLLHRFWSFPGWLAWTLLGIWVLKDIALFPLVWRAYSAEPPEAAMAGRVGEARDRLDPGGYIRVGEELWQAELHPGAPPVEVGARVKITAQRGLTLLVEKVDPPSGS